MIEDRAGPSCRSNSARWRFFGPKHRNATSGLPIGVTLVVGREINPVEGATRYDKTDTSFATAIYARRRLPRPQMNVYRPWGALRSDGIGRD